MYGCYIAFILLVNICTQKHTKLPVPSIKINIASCFSHAVLGRVQSFLPQLKEADQELSLKLQSESKGDLDIENVEEGEACIEMVSSIKYCIVKDMINYRIGLKFRG